MSDYLIFHGTNFENIRQQLNENKGIPPEGRINYYRGEPAPDKPRTMNYVEPSKHPTLDKRYIRNIDMPQFVIDAADEILTQTQMEEQNYFFDNDL